MQASRCRPVFQSTELRQTLLAHTARGPGREIEKGEDRQFRYTSQEKGKAGGTHAIRGPAISLQPGRRVGDSFSYNAGTRRWIVPKGCPIKGLSPIKSAAREAFEEAGVTRRWTSWRGRGL